MWTSWIFWISSARLEHLLWCVAPLLIIDAPRYTLSSLLAWIWDVAAGLRRWLSGARRRARFDHCPSVCVIVAGFNEAATLWQTLTSVWDSYPCLEMIVVDDGSDDGMAEVAELFAGEHAGVKVLRRFQRGGKSSALNFAAAFTQAEILVYLDSDSQLEPDAIWEIVQPFADPNVGAVAGAVLGRNAFTNLVTWTQAWEYLRCIFLGRMFMSRMAILGIVSGAFGAYRRQSIKGLGGFDVGPGEDADMALRLRKSGYDIAFAPYAQCLTNLPTSWLHLLNQRRRWEWAVVTFECRKHVDLANVLNKNFRLSSFVMLCDRWLFNVVLQFVFWGYFAWLLFHVDEHTWKLLLLYYLCCVAMELLQALIVLYYSNQPLRDLAVGLAAPLMPFHNLALRAVRFAAVLEELIGRRSYRDDFVPAHVRRATWHW